MESRSSRSDIPTNPLLSNKIQIQKLKEVIDDISLMLFSVAPDGQSEIEPELKLESYLSCQQLKLILKNLNKNNLDLPINEDNLRPLILFVKERGKNIKKTDAIYCFQPDTAINLICVKIANIISAVNEKHPYNLLMPFLPDANTHRLGERFLGSFSFTEFILDAEDRPISVLDTLFLNDNICQFQSQWSHQALVEETSVQLEAFPHGNFQKFLDSSTAERLVFHSRPVREFRADILQDVFLTHVEKSKIKLQEAYHHFDDKIKVTASYGEEGLERLRDLFFEKIFERNEFVQSLSEALPYLIDQRIFLSRTDINDLFRINLSVQHEPDIKELTGQMKNKFYEGAEKKLFAFLNSLKVTDIPNAAHARSLLLVFCEIYKRIRCALPEYTSTTGYYLGSWMPCTATYSKEKKLASLEVLVDFLISGKPLEQLEEYLKVNHLHELYWKPLSESSAFANQSLLSLFTQRTIEFGEHFKKLNLLTSSKEDLNDSHSLRRGLI